MYISILTIVIVLLILKKYMSGRITNRRKSMKDKVIVITGASDGIGRVSAQQLLEDGAVVIFACRDLKKGSDAIASMSDKRLLKNAHLMKLDLSSFGSVKKFVSEFKSKFPKIDILMNNAGAFPMCFNLTVDKIEDNFQSNYLSHVLLTFMLLDHFDTREGKIINIASLSHQFSDLSVDICQKMIKEKDFSKFEAYFNNLFTRHTLYANTKLGNILFTNFLAEYLQGNHPQIKTASVHPGIVRSGFLRFLLKSVVFQVILYSGWWAYYMISKGEWHGSQTQLDLTYMDNEELVNGGYYNDCKLTKVSSKAQDRQLRDVFVKLSAIVIEERANVSLLEKIIKIC